jgi:hypothetical protein
LNEIELIEAKEDNDEPTEECVEDAVDNDNEKM